MKSKAEKIRELVMKEVPAKEIAAKLKVPISTVYTTKWKMKNTKPTPQVKATIKKELDKAKSRDVARHNDLVSYLMKELETTRKLISDAQAIETYLLVRVREAFADRA